MWVVIGKRRWPRAEQEWSLPTSVGGGHVANNDKPKAEDGASVVLFPKFCHFQAPSLSVYIENISLWKQNFLNVHHFLKNHNVSFILSSKFVLSKPLSFNFFFLQIINSWEIRNGHSNVCYNFADSLKFLLAKVEKPHLLKQIQKLGPPTFHQNKMDSNFETTEQQLPCEFVS